MTDFRQDKAIYLQMAERLCDEILSGKYGPGGEDSCAIAFAKADLPC